MLKNRLIACLLWRDGLIVQSVNFNHTNFVGDALTAVDFFNTWAIDEIVILDVSRNAEKRDLFFRIIDELSARSFVPLTVGGKIRTIEDIRKLLQIGADKVCVNSEAFKNSQFVMQAAEMFGSQCIVVSIDVKKINDQYRVFINNGQTDTGTDPVGWAKQAEALGAGEIFLTSIDRDGSREGYDLELIAKVSGNVRIPVIASGGVGDWQHFIDGIAKGKADAVSAANIFHYSEQSTKKAKNFMRASGLNIREPEFYFINTPRKPKYRI
ncbi:MAG: imidazole glycerol phosphate synthase cyclase subunit [Patescibacteria group bacterium]|nr:imidazole glycerol phosphate synthase cyclase subunit [Patescibacteria group bacterium]